MIYNHKSSAYFHHCRDTPSEPLFAFGYGLGYSRVEYSQPILEDSTIRVGEVAKISVTLTNTGCHQNLKQSNFIFVTLWPM